MGKQNMEMWMEGRRGAEVSETCRLDFEHSGIYPDVDMGGWAEITCVCG